MQLSSFKKLLRALHMRKHLSIWDDVDTILRRQDRTPIPKASQRERISPLEELGAKYLPSKRHHDYLRWYDLHFTPFRESATKIVEVGVETDRSIKMWEEYFPNATVYGIDVADHCLEFAGGRRRIHIGDQMDADFLSNFVDETGGEFDAIIDDGLHTPSAIKASFVNLFPSLKRGGVYVVEDIINQPDTIQFFASLASKINYWPDNHPGSEWRALPGFDDQDWATQNITGLAIYRYMAFVTRGANPEDNPFLMSREEYHKAKSALRLEVNEAIDAMLKSGLAPTPTEVSKRLGNRGLTTIREELQKRSLD